MGFQHVFACIGRIEGRLIIESRAPDFGPVTDSASAMGPLQSRTSNLPTHYSHFMVAPLSFTGGPATST